LYTVTDLQNLLGLPVAGDVSISLAHQLIAAKFNVLNGTNPATDDGAIAAADTLLATFSGKLPLGIAASTTVGAQMVSLAAKLDYFNQDGQAQPGCTTAGGTGSKGSIGNFVWKDLDNDGLQDMGEPGIANVTVVLRNVSNGVIATTTTNSKGQYQFTNLGAAVYMVEVVTPSGYMPSPLFGTTNEDLDSNPSPSTVTITLTVTSVQNIDFGFWPKCTGTIGDFIWKDLNGDGIQASGEGGLAGVLLTLSGTGVAATTTSGLDGKYLFQGLCAGSYSVSVTTPGGYLATKALAGKDRGKDSNASPSTVTLSTNSSSNLTIDFGFKTTSSTASGYTTYTQGGWGATPNGKNAGALLTTNFSRVYTGGSVVIGGTYKLTFTSACAIEGFLPQGGTPGTLTQSASNPTLSAAKVFAGQVLALQLSVDFSNAGITKTGLAARTLVSGKLVAEWGVPLGLEQHRGFDQPELRRRHDQQGLSPVGA
jgi:hypothetical protein